MRASVSLVAVFALGLPAMALQRLSDPAARSGSRVLIIDIRGPTRETGDGVRLMGMLMDLQACGHHVEVLSDAADYDELKSSWPHTVTMDYFVQVHFWRAADTSLPTFELTSFDRFIVGAKLDLLYTDGHEGVAVPYILQRLRTSGYREKVVAFWDDVPFERCYMRPEADEICPRVPSIVKQVAQVAHKFYVLSIDDKNRMTSDMQNNGIPMQNLEVAVWPMRIANMQKVVPYQQFTLNPVTRNLVVMMGNLHAVNTFMVTKLFESGAVMTICNEIAARNSDIKIFFMGGIAKVAREQRHKHPLTSSCTEVHMGFMSDSELEQNIHPHTRAVLNPFFQDVNSGISVKNFESIMSGVPFLTSEFGMHGLSDEIEACAGFPMPLRPRNATSFAQFFIKNVIDHDGYRQFASAFAVHAPSCIQGQLNRYPINTVC